MTLDFRNVIHQVIKHNGLNIGVEFRPGDIRHKGTGFEKKMRSGYGHLRGIKGADGEAADAYLHPDMFNTPPGGSDKIFTVAQLNKNGEFDEHKHMIGWDSKEDAKDAYLEAMPESFFGRIEETTPESLQYAELTADAIQDKYDRLSPDRQKQFMRKVAYDIVDSNYGDRISNFNLDDSPKPGSVASGSFATPKLGGKLLIVDYVIKDNGVVLTPRNLAVINNSETEYLAAIALGFSLAEKVGYSPLELYNYARTLKCDKGWACGGACLSKEKKNCHRALEGEHKTYVDFLKHHVSKGNPLHKGHREKAEKLGIKKSDDEPEKIADTPLTQQRKKKESKPDIKDEEQKVDADPKASIPENLTTIQFSKIKTFINEGRIKPKEATQFDERRAIAAFHIVHQEVENRFNADEGESEDVHAALHRGIDAEQIKAGKQLQAHELREQLEWFDTATKGTWIKGKEGNENSLVATINPKLNKALRISLGYNIEQTLKRAKPEELAKLIKGNDDHKALREFLEIK